MNILILHRIPYHKIDYHRGIDHAQHRVVYLGTETALSSIPKELNCERWPRLGKDKTEVEAIDILAKKSQTFDCVISLSEYELMSAAIIREHFSIPGSSIEQINKVRNKLLMKNVVEASGLAVPQNLSLFEFVNISDVKWQSQTVLKPLDGASSENVLIFDSPSLLRDALRNNDTGITQLDTGDYSNYGVEQFIKGDILHIDGLILKGELKLIVTSQYIGNCLDFANGAPLGSIQIETTKELKKWTIDVLRATDLTTGSFHLEAIATEQGPVFLEVANRVGGADVVDTMELATGVHLPSVELKAYLGEPIDIPKQTKESKKYGWFVFPGHHLEQQYCVVKNTERFSQDPRIVRWKQLNTTQKLTKHITYQATEVPISGVVGAQTSQKISDFIRDLFATATVS